MGGTDYFFAPYEELGPYYDFIHENKNLFDGHDLVANSTFIYVNIGMRTGYNPPHTTSEIS